MQIIEELTLTAISLVFLLLGVVLIASILFSAFNPYEQIAVANTRKLAAIMNQACVSGGSSIEFQFDLPQHVPVGSNFLTVLPKWLMRNFGDPNFVLYYESFPPGEAIGWETYHKFDHRLYIILPESFEGKGVEGDSGVKSYVNKKKDEFAKNNPDKLLEGAVVVNIVLNDVYSGITLEKRDITKEKTKELLGEEFGKRGQAGGTTTPGSLESQKELFFGFGAWESAKQDGTPDPTDKEDYFQFKNYRGLPVIEKTLIKYESCGPYALCLKTRGGVYRFPLNNCKTNNIKAVQLVYDARNRKTVYGVLGVLLGAGAIYGAGAAAPAGATQLSLPFAKGILSTIGKSAVSLLSKVGKTLQTSGRLAGKTIKFSWRHPLTAGGIGSLVVEGAYNVVESATVAMFSLKTGNLVLASPCHIEEAKVVVTSCTTTSVPNAFDYSPCSSYVKYPIFEVNTETEKLSAARDKIGNVIYHYECADRAETKPAGTSIEDANPTPPILLEENNNDNAKCIQLKVFEKPGGFCWTPDPTSNNFIFWDADTRELAYALGFSPVRDAFEYVPSTNDIALTPTRNEELEDFAGRWERRFSWGWPGFDFTGPVEFTTELGGGLIEGIS